MQYIPEEIKMHIISYIHPSTTYAVNRHLNMLSKSNQIWGPIAYSMYKICKSNNFMEEFKWMKRVEKHRLDYKRRWTQGCVGKFEPLPEKPDWQPAYTRWDPDQLICTT